MQTLTKYENLKGTEVYSVSEVAEDEEGNTINLRYFVTEENCIGIQASTDTKKGVEEEIKISSHSFDTYEEAVKFVDMLKKNTVTPCTLQDIIEDYLAE